MTGAHQSSPGASIRVSIPLLIIANALTAGTQVVALSLLNRWGSTVVLGDFIFASSVWAPVLLFGGMRLRGVLTSDQNRRRELKDYLRLQSMVLLILVPLVTGIMLVKTWDFRWTCAFLLVGLAKGSETTGEIPYGQFQLSHRPAWITWSRLNRALLSILGLAIGLQWPGGLMGAALGLFLGGVVVLLGFEIPRGLELSRHSAPIHPHTYDPDLFGLFKSALPLGMTAVLISLTVNVPRYMVKASLGTEELALFGSMGYFLAGGTLVINATCNSFLPRIAASFKSGNLPEFRRLSRNLVLLNASIGVVGAVVAALAGNFLFHTVLGFSSAKIWPAFFIVMASGVFFFAAHGLQFILLAVDRYKAQIPAVLVDLFVTATLSWLLIPTLGITGAALSILFGGVIRFSGFLKCVQPLGKEPAIQSQPKNPRGQS